MPMNSGEIKSFEEAPYSVKGPEYESGFCLSTQEGCPLGMPFLGAQEAVNAVKEFDGVLGLSPKSSFFYYLTEA